MTDPALFDPRLGRLPETDARNANFPIRALLSADQRRKLRSFTWRAGAVLDQQRESACVGFAWAAEAAARPDVVPDITDAVAQAIYKRAQDLDQWDGSDYSGTSVLAGAKAVAERGWLTEYRWAFGASLLEDLVTAVAYHGPAVLGIEWHQDSYNTDDKGFLRITGPIAGGHAILLHTVKLVFIPGTTTRTFQDLDLSKSYGTLRNSWGLDFGIGGSAKVRLDDLNALLSKPDADCCIPVRRRPR